MHVVFRESHGLEETATAVDLGQDPADLVVLSFSDSDLAAFAAGWRRGRKSLPSLRLANLVALRHPLSVDTYIERTLSQARGILVRLIGGESYWHYGINALHQLAKAARHRARGAAGRRPRRCAARCALDRAGLDACGGCARSAMPAARWRRRSRSRSSRWRPVSMRGRCSARPRFPRWDFTIPRRARSRRCRRRTESRTRWSRSIAPISPRPIPARSMR